MEDRVSILLAIVSFLIPIAGVIIGLVKRGKGCVNSGNVYLAIGVISGVMNFVIMRNMF